MRRNKTIEAIVKTLYNTFNKTHTQEMQFYFHLLAVLLPTTWALLEAEVGANSNFYYYEQEVTSETLIDTTTASLSSSNVHSTIQQRTAEMFASYKTRRRLETGLPELGSEDYLFRNTREYLCAGVNEIRAHYKTVKYTDPNTGSGPEREYCATNGTELKASIEQGPDEMWVVVPRGRVIRLGSVGSILIRQGQTVHLRANNGTTSLDGEGITRMFVVHGNLVADTLVFVNGKSAASSSSYTWTSPPIEMRPTTSGGAVHLAGGRASAWFVDCTFFNNNYGTTALGRDIWNEGDLTLHYNNFAPGWDDAPQPIRNDGTITVSPEGS